MSPLPPLWRCPACSFKTRDTAAVVEHAKLPRTVWLKLDHAMYAPATLDHPALALADIASAARDPQSAGRA